MASIVVSASMLRNPTAGNVAAVLQYVLGLRLLGHDVLYLEEKGWRGSCLDPDTGGQVSFPRASLAFVRALLDEHGARVPVAWVDADAGLVEGMLWPQLHERLAGADLVVELGSPCRLSELRLARVRAFVDVNPLFTQLEAIEPLEHDLYFTYGANVGLPWCGVPTGAVEWLPTLPPVIPALWEGPRPWPRSAARVCCEWSSYEGVEHDGAWYGRQDGELERLADMPGRVDVSLELELSYATPRIRERFESAGWILRDPPFGLRALDSYRDHVQTCQALLAPAHQAHVATACGFLGDTAVHHLAAGRPVIAQETGIAEHLTQAGAGLLTFETPAQAARALGQVSADLARHSQAARALANRAFHFRGVLESLLDRSLCGRLGAAA